MKKSCKIHNEKVKLFCFYLNCNDYLLCHECLRVHNQSHLPKIFLYDEVYTKDDVLIMERPNNIFSKSISKSEEKIIETENNNKQIIDTITSILDELLQIFKIKREEIILSFKDYILKDLVSFKNEKDKFSLKFDLKTINSIESFIDYIQQHESYNKSFLVKESQNLESKMKFFNNFINQFKKVSKEQLNNLNKFFDEEVSKILPIINNFNQISSKSIEGLNQGDGMFIDSCTQNLYIFNKSTKFLSKFKSYNDIKNPETFNINMDFKTFAFFNNIIFFVDKTNTLIMWKEGNNIKDVLFNIEIIKIDFTIDNNILLLLKDKDRFTIKMYSLDLEFIKSIDFVMKEYFNSIIIKEDFIYFLVKKDEYIDNNYNRSNRILQFKYNVIGLFSISLMRNLDPNVSKLTFNVYPSESFVCYEDKVYYISSNNIYENRINTNQTTKNNY